MSPVSLLGVIPFIVCAVAKHTISLVWSLLARFVEGLLDVFF